jgi:hypothetical protein
MAMAVVYGYQTCAAKLYGYNLLCQAPWLSNSHSLGLGDQNGPDKGFGNATGPAHVYGYQIGTTKSRRIIAINLTLPINMAIKLSFKMTMPRLMTIKLALPMFISTKLVAHIYGHSADTIRLYC